MKINDVCATQRPNSVSFYRYLVLIESLSRSGYDVTRIYTTQQLKKNFRGGLKLHFEKHKHIVTINNSNKSIKGNKQTKNNTISSRGSSGTG
jgi:hypothetical protein